MFWEIITYQSRRSALSWRNVIISNPARLSCKDKSLVISQDYDYRVPLEDISSIIIDSPQVVLTQPVLSKAADYGIVIYSTDSSHTPNGIFLPFLQHNSPLRILNLQLNCPKPVSKRLRAAIISSKIHNQAQCLRITSLDGAGFLDSLSKQVRSGDPDNIESRAAIYYFKIIFGPHFGRRDETSYVNSCLNYGYAVLRGEIARRLVAHGLFPPLGIFHCNQKNSFNLADDLIEPFRPIVDIFSRNYVNSLSDEEPFVLPKAQLVNLLNYEVSMPEGDMAISLATEYVIESYVRVLSNPISKISLPIIKEFVPHQYSES